MSAQTVKLIDQDHNVVAVTRVTEEDGHYGGTVDLSQTPSGVRVLFEEFEEIVNGQMFSFLDEIERKIAALPIKAVFGDGGAVPVRNLQVYPTTNEISFKLAAGDEPDTARERASATMQ